MTDEREEAAEAAIRDIIDELLDDYGHLLSPADRELARTLLADVLATHPVTSDLIELIVPAPVVDHSDKVAKHADKHAGEGDDDAAAGGDHE